MFEVSLANRLVTEFIERKYEHLTAYTLRDFFKGRSEGMVIVIATIRWKTHGVYMRLTANTLQERVNINSFSFLEK